MKAALHLLIPFIVIALAVWFALRPAQARATDELWQDVEPAALRQTSQRTLPRAYRALRLNAAALDQLLAQAPLETPEALAQSPVVLALPLPKGGFTRFRLVESPIMEPALAAQFPQIKTYTGQGLDDPTATLRCDVSPRGFHALALTAHEALYIDPDTSDLYLSYYRKDYPRDAVVWNCAVRDQAQLQAEAAHEQALSNGATLRTYRLAVAATGEYTAFHGGSVDRALAAITTTVNRVNAIYQRDFAVRFTLVAGETRIIYTDPNNDPYTNNDGRQLIQENQRNLDAVIGTGNYDVGHVFGTGGGGLALLGSVCSSSYKAMGQTGSPAPIGDPFDVDYVSHELGHQFGANHTFNGAARNCNGNRETSAAYEPGSGSTIMGYTGICGEQDLQPHSDPYFHVRSLEEVTTFITNGGGATCGAATSTGNAPPNISAGGEFTIPARTPFTLTAQGSDPNGNALTFAWEQYDLGPASPPDTDDGARPIFRSFAPRTEPARAFPRLADVLANTATYGEALPTTSRQLTFQVTARDNQATGGAIATALTRVRVQAGNAPFALTQPNTAVTWAGGSTQLVTWDVAQTNAPPVNCANVKLTLSTDGGQTFPIVLADSTPNDGSQNIVVPNAATSAARVKVEAAGNIFFDIGNANFTITGGGGGGNTTVALTSGVAQTGMLAAPAQANEGVFGTTQYTIQTPANATQLKLELSGNQDVDLYARFGQPVTYTNGTPQADFISESPTGTETITITPTSAPALQAGTYYVAVANYGPGAASFSVTATVTGGSSSNRVLRVASSSGAPGGSVSVPLELVAQGDENALGFSLTFEPTILSNPQAALGRDAAGATLNANTSQANNGRLGLALALPSGQKFSAGARQIIVVTFTVTSGATASSTPLGFGDQPIAREVSDVNAHALSASYTPDAVALVAGLESDVAPRPGGNGAVTITDWVQIGRFVAGQDTAAGGEFQRADCAPRDTRGNGSLTITDWVQAGRYAAGLDTPVAAGGPSGRSNWLTTNMPPAEPGAAARAVRIHSGASTRGQQHSVVIELNAQGNENALGFSLAFDPNVMRFLAAVNGRDAGGATLNVNTAQTAQGRLGLVLALPAGHTLPAGQRQVVVITFAVSGTAPAALAFGDQPVTRELSDANAQALPVRFTQK